MIEPEVQAYSEQLNKLGVGHKIVEHPDLGTPAEVQSFLGLTLADGLSTMIMRADNSFIAVIRRDDCRLDFGKIRKILGIKSLRMATADEFVELTHLPLGAARVYNPGLKTLLDNKLFEKDVLTGGTGSFTCSFRYVSEDLKNIPSSVVVDITETEGSRPADSNKIVFSGIQPSGNLHIGNYIGAVRQWVKGQNDPSTGSGQAALNIFCVVDMHAITVPQDPKTLQEKTREISAIILSAGIDPEKSLLFIQSHNPDHANLGWILNCYLSMGQLNRMTQYKEKSVGREFASVGLFDYPALMAADILLYGTTEVPIGDDQKQHVELTRDAAEKFNSKYGPTFAMPTPIISKEGGRVMSLTDPTKKMSKSDPNPNGAIGLLEDPKIARKKIMSAVTDSGSEVKYDWGNKPGISNLLDILSQFSNVSIPDLEKKFAGQNYGQFKTAVADSVEMFLVDFQKKYAEILKSGKLESILKAGAQKAYQLSHPKLLEVYKKVGFLGQ